MKDKKERRIPPNEGLPTLGSLEWIRMTVEMYCTVPNPLGNSFLKSICLKIFGKEKRTDA